MEAVYWGNTSAHKMSKGAGYGPWVMADLENGVWAGHDSPVSKTNTPVVADYVTAMVKGKAGGFGVKVSGLQVQAVPGCTRCCL
jgi:hypothetical protein